MTTFTLNGETRTVDDAALDPDTPLLWYLRDEVNLTGTKFGCGIAQCGNCTVHVDGYATRSCQTRVSDLEGATVVTIEGVGQEGSATTATAKAVQQAWRELDVVQCGYCQSGQIMGAIALLSETPRPSDDDIDGAMDGNACRCATYHRIRAAIHRAADILEG